MSTKVKGEAIKEGSIPLSALSNEVKNKIENAGGGADWNAQEGEAGYIENKPFIIIKGNNSNITNINNYFISTESEFYPTVDLFIKYNNKIALLAKEKQALYWGDGIYKEMDGAMFYIGDDGETNIIIGTLDDVEFELIIALSSDFIPDTVIKTTPQELSDVDKNQALANLGIDPVVWKYMCEPYIISVNEPIPDEIVSIIANKKQNTLLPIIKNICVVRNYNYDDEYLLIESIICVHPGRIITKNISLIYDLVDGKRVFVVDE